HPHFKHMLAGSVSVAVLAFAIVNIDQIIPDTATPPPKTTQNKNAPVSQITELDEAKRSPEGVVRRRQDGEALPKDSSSSSDKPAKLQKNEAEVALLDSATSQADVPEPSPPVALSNDQRILRLMAPSPRKMAGELARSKTKSRQMHGNKGAVAYQSVQNGLIKKVDDVTNPRQYQDQGRDKFTEITPNATKLVSENPVSTFSVDVDTASYSFVRSSLNRGVLPQKNAVRIEELINYFDYAYKAPENKTEPFSTNVSIMPTPWNAQTKLMRIGIKGYDLPKTRSPHANLVFLIDTSGSMNSPDKLPLLRNSFKLLLASLKPDDTVAIVTYAGSAGTALEPTKVADKNKILSALDRLNSRGSTAGAEGIRRAYQLAEQQMDKNGVNRV
ncbi:MAG: VWA domain-containing protein, partial [bacterium]|nr:VWA domain-containing protein [bacterium]